MAGWVQIPTECSQSTLVFTTVVLRRYSMIVLRAIAAYGSASIAAIGVNRPNSNPAFWTRKLDGNVARDSANRLKLKEQGWSVFIIWECPLKEDTIELLNPRNGLRINTEQKGQCGTPLPTPDPESTPPPTKSEAIHQSHESQFRYPLQEAAHLLLTHLSDRTIISSVRSNTNSHQQRRNQKPREAPETRHRGLNALAHPNTSPLP